MYSWSDLNVSLKERNNKPEKLTMMEQAMRDLQAMSNMDENLFQFVCKKLRDPTNQVMFAAINHDERMSYVHGSDTYEEEIDDLPDIDSEFDPVEDYEPLETSLMVGSQFQKLVNIYESSSSAFSPLRRMPYRESMYSGLDWDCIGAIDGTIIPAWVPERQQGSYRCRKRYLVGWEGSANDARIFNQTLSTPDIISPIHRPVNQP
ncbi:Unknown protein [Striga hermonthica]|uniref:Uncharacterized protein n=1 Tax=Striga hermonthica TaxID=68872 RepID=A0A9N7NU49_STRHE|nr:Unknown protein [Striga hermonthica]